MNGPPPPLMTPYSADEPGPYCTAHRTTYCEDVIGFIEDRQDVESLTEELKLRANGRTLTMSLPLYPQYCVWETVQYVGAHDKVFGSYAKLPLVDGDPALRPIAQVMAGDSAFDLAMVLRENFEDEAQEVLGRRQADLQTNPRLGIPWQCKGRRHSVKYQNTVVQILGADAIASAQETNDFLMQYAVLYALMRYNMCLFCWVNETKREAVQANPVMSAMFPDVQTNPPNFDDLVPF